jgi:hypothetical protein
MNDALTGSSKLQHLKVKRPSSLILAREFKNGGTCTTLKQILNLILSPAEVM